MHCNHTLPDDSEFCQYCGSKIEMNIAEEIADKSTGLAEENTFDASVRNESEEDFDDFGDVDVENIDHEEAVKMILGIQAKQTVKSIDANIKNQPNYEGDSDFGLVPEKPIYTLGVKLVDGEREFLNSLLTSEGEKIKWERRGSVSAKGIHGMIDIYDTYLPSGQLYKTIYINMYGAKRSTKAPVGFVLNDVSLRRFAKYKKEKEIKTKYCSRCGSKIDNQNKICTGCGRKYFKIRLNKFSLKILIMSVVIAVLAILNIFQCINIQNLQKEIEALETQVQFYDRTIVIAANDGTKRYHKYGCVVLDKTSSYAILNVYTARSRGYAECPYCH